MGCGIVVCGMNGCGKSTLGRALAEKLGFYFIDIEDLYFPKTDASYEYASPRTKEECERLLADMIQEHENFVFCAVKGDYGEDVVSRYRYAIFLEVPKEIRLQRVWDRSHQKFGERMLEGGDLYEKERVFLELVSVRDESYAKDFAMSLTCPLICIDGTGLIEESISYILKQIC